MRALSCHPTPFQALNPDKENTKEENYKRTIRQIKLSLSTQFPLLHRPLAPPSRVVNSPQNSSSSPWSWMRMSADHQAVCLMLLLPPVVREEDECRPPGCLLDVVAPTSLGLLPASLSTKGSSFPGRYCDPLFSEFGGSSIYVCVFVFSHLPIFYIWFFLL